jgi:hypothetical protein
MMKPAAAGLLISVLVSGAAAGTLRWTEPAAVWPDTTSGDTLYQGMAAVAGADTVLWAAWWQQRGSESDSMVTKAARHDGVRWHVPERIRQPEGVSAGLSMALDNEQDPWIAYRNYILLEENRCAYARRTADTWTQPAVFYRYPGGRTRPPILARHPVRGVQAVWVSFYSEAHLLTAQGTADSWTTPHIVDSFPAYTQDHPPSIALLSNNRFMLAWPCTSRIAGWNLYTSIGSGDSWTEPVHVVFPSPQQPHLDAPLVWADPFGAARIAWQRWRWYEGWTSEFHSARFDGSQWLEPVLVDTGGTLVGCSDEAGWGWTLYFRKDGRSSVRYHDGTHWSPPMPGPPDSIIPIPRIAVAFGRVWVFWVRRSNERSLVYYSSAGHPQAVSEPGRTPLRQPAGPTIVRGFLSLQSAIWYLQSGIVLLDVTGRKVMDLLPGENDVRHLSPGVYFLRSADSGERPAVRKVVVQR